MRALRDRFEAELIARIDDIQVNGGGASRLPNTSHVSFLGRDGALLLSAVPEVMASTGSACHTDGTEPSHVLAAIGVSPAAMRGAVRFSLGRGTTEDQIGRVLAMIAVAASRSSARGGDTARGASASPKGARRP